MKTHTFIRINVSGVMAHWMSMSENINKNILGHAALRLGKVRSSNICRWKRIEVDPNAIEKIIKVKYYY